MRPALLRPSFLLLAGFYFLVFFAGYQLFPIVPIHLRAMAACIFLTASIVRKEEETVRSS